MAWTPSSVVISNSRTVRVVLPIPVLLKSSDTTAFTKVDFPADTFPTTTTLSIIIRRLHSKYKMKIHVK
eukprot:m.251163 g.251163  ORF g.251163 m.251163 type:complete len:69 (-) comp130872_c0_seq1:31-237(-)